MRTIYWMVIVLGMLSWASFLFADGTPEVGKPTEEKSERPELWFPVGECLTYKVRWGIFPIGYMKVLSEWIKEDGRDLVAIRILIKSSRILSTLYPVDDFLESIVEPRSFTPLRFTRCLKEGHHRLHEVITFDHKQGMAYLQDMLKDKSEYFTIESDTRDMLSFMFFMRAHKFEPKKNYHFRLMAGRKLYDLDVKSKDYETIKLPNFGRIQSLQLVPSPKFSGVMVSIGRIKVWISDDKRCLCTRATASVPVGSVSAVLVNVEGEGNDSWSRTQDERK